MREREGGEGWRVREGKREEKREGEGWVSEGGRDRGRE